MKLLQLWRYPIKSMLGERLERARVGPLGIEGDRQRAVVDAGSGVSLSAKRHAELLLCHAWTSRGQVMIRFPNGSECHADSAQAANRLTALLNRRVVVRPARAGRAARHEFPTDLPTGAGGTFIHEPGFEAFFDSAPLHLITTATLNEFSLLQPASSFAPVRFRPNFLIETGGKGFVEDGWVGRRLSVGSMKFHVLDCTPRCVMTTRPQGDLPRDGTVLETIMQANAGYAGVELRVLETGTLRTDDPVKALD